MSLATSQTAVDTSAVQIAEPNLKASVTVLNSGSVTVYLGNAAVTTSTGFPLTVNSSLSIDLYSEALWVVAASAGAVAVITERE